MKDLDGKTALVTGASRGIGRACAIALAKEGAHVIVHYGRSFDEAERVAEEITALGGRANTLGVDLREPDGASQLASKAKALLGDVLDIFVANAGIAGAARIADETVTHFDDLFAVNVRSPYFLVQQLLPLFHEGASLIFITSIGARTAFGDLSAYSATKGALETLIKHFAAVLGQTGIRVNGVAPGIIDTDMSTFAKTDAGREVALGVQALKRLGQPEDIADIVTFLASSKSRWITGTTIRGDGGSKL